ARQVQQDAPPGYDPLIWKETVALHNEALVAFSPEEKAAIISEAKPEPYAVLPGGYGLSKLVHDGVLQAIPNGNTDSVVRYKSGALTTLIGVEKVTFTGGRQGDMLVLDAKDFKIVRIMPYFPRHLS